jgi:hypothetical protein
VTAERKASTKPRVFISYARTLDSVADYYRQQLYEVVRHPDSRTLPVWLQPFEIDLLALGNEEERVVVEIKSRDEVRNSASLIALATAVAANPGWRFDLVVQPSKRRPISNAPSPMPTDQIRLWLNDAERIGDSRRKLVVGWIALEAILRWIALTSNVPVSQSPAELIKQLVIDGLLTREDQTWLQRAYAARSSAVHGLEIQEEPDDLAVLTARVINLCTLLLDNWSRVIEDDQADD